MSHGLFCRQGGGGPVTIEGVIVDVLTLCNMPFLTECKYQYIMKKAFCIASRKIQNAFSILYFWKEIQNAFFIMYWYLQKIPCKEGNFT